MLSSILSQDIVSICLLLAEGKVNLHMEDIFSRAENFQKKHNRHFGISESDFRSMFYHLVFVELELRSHIGQPLYDLQLKELISDILSYHYVYFNDEGEHWIKNHNGNESEFNHTFHELWFGYDEKQYGKKFLEKRDMIKFFNHIEEKEYSSDLIYSFLDSLGINENILLYCFQAFEKR